MRSDLRLSGVVLGTLTAALAGGCDWTPKGAPDPNKPVSELLVEYSTKELIKAGVVTSVEGKDLPKFLTEGPLCMPGARAEFRADGTWSESEVDEQGKAVRTLDGTWVLEPSGCFRMELGPQKLGCLLERGEAFRAKDGTRYISVPQKMYITCKPT